MLLTFGIAKRLKKFVNMKIMIDLSRQLRTEAEEGSTKLPEKPKEEPAEQPQSLTDSMRPPVEQSTHTPQLEEVSEKSQVKNQEEQREEDGIQGTFIVGGSPLGWNYLFFPNDHLVYCGETKETFRQRQVTK
ncbi:hypothetical protein QJS10_CPB21g00447 [Acorus calamus]|uniref:Uncharacterized protein n=1 Tax=Acorus calamus TaxID=4465 RepID=A0AAV9C5T0_ACOCL|nr:hypothetical protein QJS10_CPB21g00447 [Acorus calamus]